MKERLKLYLTKTTQLSVTGDEKFLSAWIGDKLNSLSEENYKQVIDRAIAEICLLNGLETYDSESKSDMFIAQMRIIAKFILEEFGFLTPQELINAFYLNLKGAYPKIHQQYLDKRINCVFIGLVLSDYKAYKQNYVNANPDLLDILNTSEKPKEIEYKEDVQNEERLIILNEFFKFKTDPSWNCKLLLDCVYQRLESDNIIPKGFYKKFYRKSQIELLKEKQLEKFIPTSRNVVKERAASGKKVTTVQKNFDLNKNIDSELHQIRNGSKYLVKRYAMQLAVVQCFTYCMKKDLSIYVKE